MGSDNFVEWMFINLMVALGLVFLAAYPPVARKAPTTFGRYWRDVVASAAMAVFCMLYPWEPAPGRHLDLRMIPLGLVGWTHGWRAASVVGVVVIVARSQMAGASLTGMISTTMFTVGCIALVPLFHRRQRSFFRLVALGLAQCVIGYLALIFLNPPAGLEWNSPMWLLIALIDVIAVWLVNGAVEHVTERERLVASLAGALGSKEAVLESIPHGIVIIDSARQVTDSNQAARTLLAGTALPPQILEHADINQALHRQERISGCRVTFPWPGSGEHIVLVSVVPMQGGGAVLGLENVTSVIHEERAEARRARLELLGRMAAMAAHEIRNPLTTIKGFIQLLAGRPEFSGHRSTFGLVQSEADHINSVVGNFLELSGGQPAAPEPVLIDDVLEEVLAGVALQFPESAVAVSLAGESHLVALGDRKSLQQIVRNLVANAYEAMPGDGILTLRRSRSDNAVCIAVSDTGPGIAAEVLEHIFTPYTTTKVTGTGLGLAISHKMAGDMGASLSVNSQAGEGCTFLLYMPEAPAAVRAEDVAG